MRALAFSPSALSEGSRRAAVVVGRFLPTTLFLGEKSAAARELVDGFVSAVVACTRVDSAKEESVSTRLHLFLSSLNNSLVQVTIAVEGLESGNLLVVFDGNTATPFKTLVYFVSDPGFGADISLCVTFVTCGEDARARWGGSRGGKSE